MRVQAHVIHLGLISWAMQLTIITPMTVFAALHQLASTSLPLVEISQFVTQAGWSAFSLPFFLLHLRALPDTTPNSPIYCNIA